MLQAEGPNAAQIEYWNEVSGPKWARLGDRIDQHIAPLGARALEWAAPKADERVLDIGCGCGQTSFALAERVGADGSVLGIDISGPMLEVANARLEREGVSQLSFLQADAQTHDFGGETFDLLYSRFGVMFFTEPRAAFEALRSTLAPAGRMAFVCWQSPDKNGWMTMPARAAAAHVEMPAPGDPEAPGPFAFADRDRLHGILDGAGFRNIEIEGHEDTIDVLGSGDLDETVGFMSEMGPAGAVLREASADVRTRALAAIRELLESHERHGRIDLPAAVWLVRATGA